jgi:antitoxin (DNA-binding transcriptional repressor) of toxin-antitoxin stability system
MIKVNIQEAKTHLSRYISRVEQGDVVVVLPAQPAGGRTPRY